MNEKNSKTLEEERVFVQVYLGKLASNAKSFRNFFGFLGALFWSSLLLNIVISLFVFSLGGFAALVGAVQLLFLAVYFVVFAWGASLSGDFANLQLEKISHDLKTQLSFRDETMEKSDEILKAAEKRAGNMVTNSGDNAVILIGDGTIGDVNQNKKIEGNPEIISLLSLIISYVQETKNEVATLAANEFAEEAAKPTPDKGMLATLWAKIVAAEPAILSVAKIVAGVRDLF